MSARSDESSAKRRKIRKGTRSCWECRRRKVKCIFASAEDSTCITCRQRSSKCVSQLDPDGPALYLNHDQHGAASSYHQFTGEEGDDLHTAFASPPTGSSSSSSYTPATNLPTVSVAGQSLGLPPTPTSHHALAVEPTAHAHTKVTEAILSALPCRRDLEMLVEHVDRITYANPYSFRACMASRAKPQPQKQHSSALGSLLHPASHPVMLAKQIFLLVAGIRQIRPSHKIPNLSRHHHVIMHELAELAIRMVTTNDVLLGTLEGLENVIFEAHYHVDSGNIRRAWITMRRAVMAGQLLGLHRPGQYRFKMINEKSDLDPELMLGCIVTTERSLSLLLGLPTSTGALSSITSAGMEAACCYNLTSLLSTMTAKVLERNQINASDKALEMTRDMDKELVHMTEKLPSDFWRPLDFAGLRKGSEEAVDETRRAWEQMYYYTVVNQLHLPYMMSPKHAAQRGYSRIACANASREVLNREIALRTFDQDMALSRMSDFLALIAGMTLVLAHATSHCPANRDEDNNGINPLSHQRPSDRAIVERALECMTNVSQMHEDVLAVKCAGLLRDLLAIEADAAESMRQGGDSASKGLHQRNMLIVIVPYLGAIRINRQGIRALAPTEAEQHRGPSEGVTIGGIGSMHVTTPRGPVDSTEDAGCFLSLQASPATGEPDASVPGGYTARGLFGDGALAQEELFPDAAAPLDDWVLQGFDTAFFDVLMREHENHGSGGSGLDTYT